MSLTPAAFGTFCGVLVTIAFAVIIAPSLVSKEVEAPKPELVMCKNTMMPGSPTVTLAAPTGFTIGDYRVQSNDGRLVYFVSAGEICMRTSDPDDIREYNRARQQPPASPPPAPRGYTPNDEMDAYLNHGGLPIGERA